jgi:hypothetical protein
MKSGGAFYTSMLLEPVNSRFWSLVYAGVLLEMEVIVRPPSVMHFFLLLYDDDLRGANPYSIRYANKGQVQVLSPSISVDEVDTIRKH